MNGDSMDMYSAVREEVGRSLSKSRRDHTLAAQEICCALARRFSLDEEAAWVAAMWHDTSREWSRDQLVSYAAEHALEITALEKRVPMLLHGAAAAHRLVYELGYEHAGVWAAVRWHTTGHPDMGPLGYALYTADFLEPLRTHITPEQRDRLLSLDSLEHMMLEIYRLQFSYFTEKDISPEPASLQLYHRLRRVCEAQ